MSFTFPSIEYEFEHWVNWDEWWTRRTTKETFILCFIQFDTTDNQHWYTQQYELVAHWIRKEGDWNGENYIV